MRRSGQILQITSQHHAAGISNRGLFFIIIGPYLRVNNCKKQDPPSKGMQKQLHQMGGQCGEESFKLGMTREGDDDL